MLLDVAVLDVRVEIGQGDAILVQTIDGKSLLVDTGPPGARKALMDRLHLRNVQSLDGLIVTHAHADHMGNGLLDTIRAVGAPRGVPSGKCSQTGSGPTDSGLITYAGVSSNWPPLVASPAKGD